MTKAMLKVEDVLFLDVQYHFDVWGNPEDGFEVNDSRYMGRMAIRGWGDFQNKQQFRRDVLQNLEMNRFIPAYHPFKFGWAGLKVVDGGLHFEVDDFDGRPVATLWPVLD